MKSSGLMSPWGCYRTSTPPPRRSQTSATFPPVCRTDSKNSNYGISFCIFQSYEELLTSKLLFLNEQVKSTCTTTVPNRVLQSSGAMIQNFQLNQENKTTSSVKQQNHFLYIFTHNIIPSANYN